MTKLEKVLNGLKCCSEGNSCSQCCPYDDDDDDFANCTTELTKDAFELMKEQPKWIPSSEKLPDEYDLVLVWSKKSGHEIMHIEKNGMSDNGVEWVNEHDYSIGTVDTWWMPLPKTPEDGEQE